MTAPDHRIDRLFAQRREQGRPALIFYLTAGYPSLAVSRTVALTLAQHGADLIELGIPFSDPIADGPTIQRACQAALDGGTTTQAVLDLTAELRRWSDIPIVLFGAYNPVLRYGLKPFTEAAAETGADGLLIPDLPPEEAGDLEGLAAAADLKLIFLAAPTSSDRRRRLIAAHSTGFIYYVSLRGVTGARDRLAEDLETNLGQLRAVSPLPIAVGFGISRPEQVRLVGSMADGVVIGSALVDLMGRQTDGPAAAEAVREFLSPLVEAASVQASAS